MTHQHILTRLATLSSTVRALAETELRQAGLLAAQAPLEEAFVAGAGTRDEACCVACDKAFDATMETCTTDACKAGAALKYAKCLKKCGYCD